MYDTRSFVPVKDVLTRLPAMTTKDDLAALNPARWQPAAVPSA